MRVRVCDCYVCIACLQQWEHVCVECILVWMGVGACGGPKLTLGVFPHCSTSYTEASLSV